MRHMARNVNDLGNCVHDQVPTVLHESMVMYLATADTNVLVKMVVEVVVDAREVD